MTSTDYKSIRESIGTQEIVASLLGIARETLARRETGKATICTESELAIRFLVSGSEPTPTTAPVIDEATQVRTEIDAIVANPACYNGNKQGITWGEHQDRFMPAYLGYLELAMSEARQVLLGEMLRFDQEAGELDPDMRLFAFQRFLGDDDVATFERWDKEFNTGNTWEDPTELRPSAKIAVDLLRKRLTRLSQLETSQR
jgi:DNA-binding XRE family transcriptional regulator